MWAVSNIPGVVDWLDSLSWLQLVRFTRRSFFCETILPQFFGLKQLISNWRVIVAEKKKRKSKEVRETFCILDIRLSHRGTVKSTRPSASSGSIVNKLLTASQTLDNSIEVFDLNMLVLTHSRLYATCFSQLFSAELLGILKMFKFEEEKSALWYLAEMLKGFEIFGKFEYI